MRALVVGLGSIGRRHLANLRALFPEVEIAVWRHARGAAESAPEANRVVFDAESAVSFRPDIAIVASPAPFHVPAATRLAEAGVHLLLEKPISDTEHGVEALISTCRKRQLVLMVGYNLRFSDSLLVVQRAVTSGVIGKLLCIRAEVGSYLPDWRPGSDYRNVVSARPELGGGALLELSHEIDYVTWLGGECLAVTAQAAHLGGFGLQVEDTAEITLQLASGGLAQIHMDMVQRVPHRTCRLIGSEGTLVWNAIAHSVELFRSPGPDPQNIFATPAIDRNSAYLAELRHFVECVRLGREPLITGEDGWRALRIVLAAKRSTAEQRTIGL